MTRPDAFMLGFAAATSVALVISLAFAPSTAEVRQKQRACVADLNSLATEADSLRLVYVEGRTECEHWLTERDD